MEANLGDLGLERMNKTKRVEIPSHLFLGAPFWETILLDLSLDLFVGAGKKNHKQQ